MRRHSIPMVTVQICRRSTSKSDGNTSSVSALLEVTCGSRFAISPKPPAMHWRSAWKGKTCRTWLTMLGMKCRFEAAKGGKYHE
jgi:hypothetical protein